MRDLITAGCVALVLPLSLAAPVAAGSYEDGGAASERGDCATALRPWRPLANQGNTPAQFNLGLIYDKGHGVPQDYVQAHKWYNLAAANLPARRKKSGRKPSGLVTELPRR